MKILNGTQPDRINRNEPAMPLASIEPPDWLDQTARKHWRTRPQSSNRPG